MKKRLTVLLCYLSITAGYCQEMDFKQVALIKVLKEITANSNYQFNYDPDLLQQYEFSGQLDYIQPLEAVDLLFMDTPLSYSVYEQKILIFLSPKKRWRICGFVLDGDTNLPLPFTNVFGPDLQTGDQTNEQGYFEFVYEGYKHERIQMSFVGYQSQEHRLQTFDSLSCKSFVLQLDPNSFAHPVVITDYLIDGITEGQSYSRIDLDYDQINNWYTNIEQDVLKTIQLIPGVTSINESAGDIQIRGSTIDQNLLLWEGATLYGPGHLFGSISSINPFVIDQVQVYKGVFDPSYANRVGGIIDLSLSDKIPEQIQGSIGTTLSEAHAHLNVPIIKDKLSILASGRNTTNQFFKSPTLDRFSTKLFQNTKVPDLKDDGVAEETLQYSDWNLKVNFRPNDKWHIKSSLFNSYNNFTFEAFLGEAAEWSSRDEVEYQTQAFNTSIAWQWAEDWKSSLGLSRSSYLNNYSFNISDLNDDQLLEDNRVLNSILDYSLLFKNAYQYNDKAQLEFGYEFNFKEVNFDWEYTAVYAEPFLDMNFGEASFHNAFIAYQYQSEKSQLNLGLRTIYYQEVNELAWSPRFNFQHQLSTSIKWKFSAGILHQYISQLREFGDTDLPLNNRIWVLNRAEGSDAQTAQKLASGIIFQQKGWLLDLEAYWHEIKGLNTLTPVLSLDSDVTGVSSGSASSIGLDVLIKKRWLNFGLWLNYSWSQVAFSFPDLQSMEFPGTNDQRHNFSLFGNYKWKKWRFSAQYQYRSSLPYSEAIGVQLVEGVEEEVFYELEYSGINNKRLSDYQRLDLSVNYYWKFNSDTKLELAFSLLNVLNRDNLFSRDFFIDFEEEETQVDFFSTDQFLLGSTPQILLRYHW